jgi:hypothetical protein
MVLSICGRKDIEEGAYSVGDEFFVIDSGMCAAGRNFDS